MGSIEIHTAVWCGGRGGRSGGWSSLHELPNRTGVYIGSVVVSRSVQPSPVHVYGVIFVF